MATGRLHLDFFDLREQLFAPTADPSYFCATRDHKSCLFRLWNSIDERHGIAVVLGSYGTGKTTLLRKLMSGMAADPEKYNTAVLLDRQGHLAGNYRKVFVFWSEKGCNLSDEGVKTFDTDFGRISRVGLGDRLLHRPAELSGGERQRVALARALVMRPRLLLCNEPTGNLDADSARVVAGLILELHRAGPSVLVLVTHSAELAARLPQRRRMRGRHVEPA